MLRVTIELVPSGRVLGTMQITNVRGNKLADYAVQVSAEGEAYWEGKVLQYARFSASIWDLVARAAMQAITREERIPERAAALDVPYYYSDEGTPYIRVNDIPQPARAVFKRRMANSTRPGFDEDQENYWAWDWEAFVEGSR